MKMKSRNGMNWQIATLLAAIVSSPAVAQVQPLRSPEYSVSDINGVDMASGSPYFRLNDLSIGGASRPLTHTLLSDGARFVYANSSRSANVPSIYPCPNKWIKENGIWVQRACMNVESGGQSESFYLSGSTYVSLLERGSSLVVSGSSYVYTARDGTRSTVGTVVSPVSTVDYPDGRRLTISYRVESVNFTGVGVRAVARIQSETRSDGYQIKYIYSNNGAPTEQTLSTWWQPNSIVAVNNAFDYCAPSADLCTFTQIWPTATYSWSGTGNTLTVADPAGRTTRYTMDSQSRVTGVKLPTSAASDNISYQYCNNACFTWDGQSMTVYYDMVARVMRDGRQWTYSFSPGGINSFSGYSSIDPAGLTKSIQLVPVFAPFTQFVSPILSVSDGNGSSAVFNPTSYTGRVGSMTIDGVSHGYTYDTRGNVTSVARAGSVRTAQYPSSCVNPVTCNQPEWVTDWSGKRTDYSYDAVHGGVLTVTSPAAANGVRPQTRFAYEQRYAWIKASGGNYVRSVNPIWVLVKESYCRTSASTGSGCMTAGDEVVTSYDYGPDAGPNNLLVRGRTIIADGVSSRTCFSYDSRGSLISETPPRAGLAVCP